jgi:hypothetical protein
MLDIVWLGPTTNAFYEALAKFQGAGRCGQPVEKALWQMRNCFVFTTLCAGSVHVVLRRARVDLLGDQPPKECPVW